MNDANRRFNIIAALFLGLLVLSFALVFSFGFSSKVILYVGLGTFGWVIFEHDYSLVETKLYLKFLFFSIIMLGLGIASLQLNHEVEGSNLILSGTSFMFSFLLLQRIFRFVFKKVVRREPTYNIYGGVFVDAFYTFVLAMASMLCPILVIEFFRFL